MGEKQRELEGERDKKLQHLSMYYEGQRGRQLIVLIIIYFSIQSHSLGGRGREKLWDFSVALFNKSQGVTEHDTSLQCPVNL